MKYAKLLSGVAEKWHVDFVLFVNSGDASEEFLAALDADRKLQEAVELALTAQFNNFEKVASRGRTSRALSAAGQQHIPVDR